MSNLTTTQVNTTIALKDLDLSNLDALLEEASSNNSSLAMREELEGNYKSSYTPFVETKIKEERITWGPYLSNKKKQELAAAGQEPHEEVTSAAEHYFVGVRGMIIKVQNGFSLYDPKTQLPLCQTTKLVDKSVIPHNVIVGDRPLEIPLKQIHKNKDNPNEVTQWLEQRPYLELYGSRPPVGVEDPDNYVGEPRTCRSCITAGEHYLGTKEQFADPNAQTPKCNGGGNILFVVFQVGILDSSAALKPGGTAKVRWVDVKDAMLQVERNGQLVQRNEPFVLKVDGLGRSQLSSLGNGQYDLNVVQTGKNCYLPNGVMSWGDYFSKYLHAKNIGEVRKIALGNETVYPVVTEIYTGKLFKPTPQAKNAPVFYPVTDKEVIGRGENLTTKDWLHAALAAYQFEVALSNGAEAQAPQLPGENKSLSPAETVEAPTTEEPEANLSKLKTRSFTAFSMQA